jgi:hypothetical protein
MVRAGDFSPVLTCVSVSDAPPVEGNQVVLFRR